MEGAVVAKTATTAERAMYFILCVSIKFDERVANRDTHTQDEKEGEKTQVLLSSLASGLSLFVCSNEHLEAEQTL